MISLYCNSFFLLHSQQIVFFLNCIQIPKNSYFPLEPTFCNSKKLWKIIIEAYFVFTVKNISLNLMSNLLFDY